MYLTENKHITITVDKDILLKNIELEDDHVIYSTIIDNFEYLKEWLPFINNTFDLDHVKTFIEGAIHISSNDLVFLIYYNNQFVGIISLKDIDQTNKKAEIGYWLAESFQKKGIVSRSCKRLIEYAFNDLHLNRIQIKVAKYNTKSQAVAARLGFIREGIERDGELHTDGFVNLIVYSLLKNDSSPYCPV